MNFLDLEEQRLHSRKTLILDTMVYSLSSGAKPSLVKVLYLQDILPVKGKT